MYNDRCGSDRLQIVMEFYSLGLVRGCSEMTSCSNWGVGGTLWGVGSQHDKRECGGQLKNDLSDQGVNDLSNMDQDGHINQYKVNYLYFYMLSMLSIKNVH